MGRVVEWVELSVPDRMSCGTLIRNRVFEFGNCQLIGVAANIRGRKRQNTTGHNHNRANFTAWDYSVYYNVEAFKLSH